MRVLSIWVFVPVTEVFTFLKNDKYYDIIALIVICLYTTLFGSVFLCNASLNTYSQMAWK
jgi:hypothetical protein